MCCLFVRLSLTLSRINATENLFFFQCPRSRKPMDGTTTTTITTTKTIPTWTGASASPGLNCAMDARTAPPVRTRSVLPFQFDCPDLNRIRRYGGHERKWEDMADLESNTKVKRHGKSRKSGHCPYILWIINGILHSKIHQNYKNEKKLM